MSAIRAGIVTPSTKAELMTAEAAIASARAHLDALKAFQPSQLLPRARERWHGIVQRLADVSRNKPEARAAIRDLLGDCITIRNDNGDIIAEVAASSEISVVAGARFGLYLTETWRVIIPRSWSA